MLQRKKYSRFGTFVMNTVFDWSSKILELKEIYYLIGSISPPGESNHILLHGGGSIMTVFLCYTKLHYGRVSRNSSSSISLSSSSSHVVFPVSYRKLTLILIIESLPLKIAVILVSPVADLRGVPPASAPPPWPKIFSISCSFSENLAKSYVSAHPWRVGTHPIMGILDLPLVTV